MDVDLGQVRAFLATVEHRHFGRAAAQLFITQQSLSKRIQRLERALGQPLLVRDGRAVELTDAGRRFLPHARRLLSTADAATAAVREPAPPLRVDVWGPRQAPVRVLRRLVDLAPDLAIDVSMRCSVAVAIQALQRHEIDAVFGRIHDLEHPWPATLAHRPVVLARAAAAVGAEHPLGDVADAIRDETVRVGLLDADCPAPAGVRLIPLDPTPLYPWSLAWRADCRHPLLELMLRLIARTADDEGWLAYDADRDWLPDVDHPGYLVNA